MVHTSRTHESARGFIFLLLVCVSSIVGCGEKPVVTNVGQAATVGGMEFTVGEYDVRYIEITDGDDTYEYPRPVLGIPVAIKNTGKASFIYSPSHSQQQMSEAQTPLLYLDPGAESALPPESKVNINGVYLEKGVAKGQIAQSTTLNPGDALDDMFFFEVPDTAQDLILSLPPSMHRGKMPVLFKLRYEPKDAKGPQYYPVGTAIDFGGAKFSVTGTSIEYVKIDDLAQGKGFSTDPLLKVSYTIENGGDKGLTYEPGHKTVGIRGAALFAKDRSLKRVKFPGTTRVTGQTAKTQMIESGKSVQDFVLFELPPEGTQKLTFEYPASLFGGSGIARYSLDYEQKLPAKPKELK